MVASVFIFSALLCWICRIYVKIFDVWVHPLLDFDPFMIYNIVGVCLFLHPILNEEI